jgi:hypothetical protein
MMHMILPLLALGGISKDELCEQIPEFAHDIEADYEVSVRLGDLIAKAQVRALTRTLGMLIADGFSRDEAIQIITSGVLNTNNKT